jgi:hypothetical protein
MAGMWDGILGAFGMAPNGNTGMLQGPMAGGQTLDTTNPGILQNITGGLQDHQAALLGLSAGLLSPQGLRGAMGQGFQNFAVGQRMDAATMKQKREEAASKLLAAYALKGNEDPGLAGALAAFPEASANLALTKLGPKKHDIKEVGGALVDVTDPSKPNVLYGGADAGGMFKGNSVEAQAINWMVQNQQLTPQQAAELGAGKTVTQPDGSTLWFSPQGLVGAKPGQQPALVVPPGQQPPAAVPGAAPAAGDAVTPPPTPTPVVPPVVPQQPPVVPPAPGAVVPPAAVVPPGARQLTPPKVGGGKTEDQAKQGQLFHDISADMPTVVKNWNSLNSLADQAGGKIPLVGNFFQSPAYQEAATALGRILQNASYSKSGASMTEYELNRRVTSMMPQPGDSQTQIAEKLKAVQAEANGVAIRSGQIQPGQDFDFGTPPPQSKTGARIISVE